MKQEWTLTGLNQAMLADLQNCQTEHERIMCKTLCLKEIREKAREFSKTRKLSPGEVSVLDHYGISI